MRSRGFVNPAHQIIVIVFFADAAQVRGKVAAHHVRTFADANGRPGSRARCSSSLPCAASPGCCFGGKFRPVNCRLPDEGGDGLDFVRLQAGTAASWWSDGTCVSAPASPGSIPCGSSCGLLSSPARRSWLRASAIRSCCQAVRSVASILLLATVRFVASRVQCIARWHCPRPRRPARSAAESAARNRIFCIFQLRNLLPRGGSAARLHRRSPRTCGSRCSRCSR